MDTTPSNMLSKINKQQEELLAYTAVAEALNAAGMPTPPEPFQDSLHVHPLHGIDATYTIDLQGIYFNTEPEYNRDYLNTVLQVGTLQDYWKVKDTFTSFVTESFAAKKCEKSPDTVATQYSPFKFTGSGVSSNLQSFVKLSWLTRLDSVNENDNGGFVVEIRVKLGRMNSEVVNKPLRALISYTSGFQYASNSMERDHWYINEAHPTTRFAALMERHECEGAYLSSVVYQGFDKYSRDNGSTGETVNLVPAMGDPMAFGLDMIELLTETHSMVIVDSLEEFSAMYGDDDKWLKCMSDGEWWEWNHRTDGEPTLEHWTGYEAFQYVTTLHGRVVSHRHYR